MSYYNDIVKDISFIPDAIDYYNTQLLQAKNDCKVSGNLEQAIAQMPGIVEFRFSQLQEIEAILEFLNIQLRKIRSQKFKKYLETYQRALSSRDCEKYVDGEKEVIDQELLINEFALLRNKWLAIIKGLENKSFTLNNVVKLRCAGMEDATI